MLNITNISENYYKWEDVIICLLTDYYGLEYYDLIKKNIGHTYIDFSSTPDEDYQYMMEHENEFSIEDQSIITAKYEQYKRIENEAREKKFCFISSISF